MNDSSDIASPEFWNQRYTTGETPWAQHRISAALDSFLRRVTTPGAVLIPGCGNDFNVMHAFHVAGFSVTAIDFSPVAVEQASAAAGSRGINLITGDFFRHDFGATRFDVIYERTFLCALSPSRWDDYANRVADLLAPDGLVAGYYFYGEEPDPPPYPIDPERAAEIFGRRFQLIRSDPVADSLPIFAGQEKWEERRLKRARVMQIRDSDEKRER